MLQIIKSQPTELHGSISIYVMPQSTSNPPRFYKNLDRLGKFQANLNELVRLIRLGLDEKINHFNNDKTLPYEPEFTKYEIDIQALIGLRSNIFTPEEEELIEHTIIINLDGDELKSVRSMLNSIALNYGRKDLFCHFPEVLRDLYNNPKYDFETLLNEMSYFTAILLTYEFSLKDEVFANWDELKLLCNNANVSLHKDLIDINKFVIKGNMHSHKFSEYIVNGYYTPDERDIKFSENRSILEQYLIDNFKDVRKKVQSR